MVNHSEIIIKHELEMDEVDRQLFHTNCAENIFRSANAKYKLGVSEEYIKMITPFGAGMQTQNTCGACLGALAALGYMFGESKPTNNEKMKAAVIKYVDLFIEKFGDLSCADIKPRWKDETGACTPTKLAAAELFEYVVNNIDEIYAEYLEKNAAPSGGSSSGCCG